MIKAKCFFDSFQSICLKGAFAVAGLLLIGLLVHSAHASQDRFGGVFYKGNYPQVSRDTNLYEVRGHQLLRFSVVPIYPFCLYSYRSYLFSKEPPARGKS
ncbi:MAG: hypothetical protein KAV87_39385, partial [Desulfobacteraceae bacterium]|nr:hypothetical protein [Desulfobacteraceae bacterium]